MTPPISKQCHRRHLSIQGGKIFNRNIKSSRLPALWSERSAVGRVARKRWLSSPTPNMRLHWRIRSILEQIQQASAARAALREVEGRWREWAHLRRPHNLSHPLVVSLTSYPPRFSSLLPTLHCLLSQDVGQDATLLWIARADADQLPAEVWELRKRGLEIKITPDVGSYKKIIPALATHPDAFIVTCDDDTYYPTTWLGDLADSFSAECPSVVCHRAHRLHTDPAGFALPYAQWEHCLKAPQRGNTIMATGVGGILYPPQCLPDVTSDSAIFLNLAPNADDLWFYCMEQISGISVTTLGQRFPAINWPGSQKRALHRTNTSGENRNDRCLRDLQEHFGIRLPRA